jgi:hypothetical protein
MTCIKFSTRGLFVQSRRSMDRAEAFRPAGLLLLQQLIASLMLDAQHSAAPLMDRRLAVSRISTCAAQISRQINHLRTFKCRAAPPFGLAH